MAPSTKAAIHDTCRQELKALLDEEPDLIARMASVAAVLYTRIPGVSFCGFYRVLEPELLVIGPYQGPVGCLRIPFDRGVCGAAAASKSPQLVADVRAFPGHIACDPEARSELVLPVFDNGGRLMAVLDLDSHQTAAFDEDDLRALVSLLGDLFPHPQ